MAWGVALMGSTALVRPSYGEAPAETPVAFSLDTLTAEMRAVAGQPYVAPASALPPALVGLDYDQYRFMEFRPERAKWAGSESGFQIQAFHLGWLYNEPVALFDLVDGKAEPMVFTTEDFSYHGSPILDRLGPGPLPGVAGFRINYPINRPDWFDEVAAFLGASYFRALGRNNLYGLSARGLAINSWGEGPEEFPRFSRFYLQRPASGQPLVMFAALEGPTITGAYRFEVTPGSATEQATLIDVTARLFFRADIKQLGIAPLTSMFLFGENNRHQFDDYRGQVHDSNGLFVSRNTGETFWRSLNNPPQVANSFFAETNPVAFGLHQRGRAFDQYQDAGAHYERRPSLTVEPIGEWGKGAIRLIEVPTKLEVEDNIVAFWVPDEPAVAGGEREFRYKLRWGNVPPESLSNLAYVLQARSGIGGVSGVANEGTARKFVVDFTGGAISTLDPEEKLDAFTGVSGGRILVSTLSKIADTGIWRLVMDVEPNPSEVLELRAYIVGFGRKLTETWLYQWRAPA